MSNKQPSCISFLTGLPFNPNSEKLNKPNRQEDCLMTRKQTKKYMQNNNKIYFDNKTWLKNHSKSVFKQNHKDDRIVLIT